MRLDANGSLLINQTVGNVYNQSSVTGLKLDGPNGNLEIARSNNPTLLLNRYGNDGDLALFFKNGLGVGSIGTGGGDLNIGTGDTRIRFNDATDNLIPLNASNGYRDNAISLGDSGARFKDLYLSGGVLLGGTGARVTTAASGDLITGQADTGLRFYDGGDAIIPRSTSDGQRNGTTDLGASNARFKDLYLSGGVVFGPASASNVSSQTLDDYEEGTFTPTVSGDATGVIESVTVGGYYTKVGNQVTLYFNFRVTTNFNGSYVGGLPFQVNHGSMSSSWITGGVVLGGASNTVSAGLQNGTSVVRLFNNNNLADTHEPNTTMDYYRLQLSYRTDS